MLFSLSLNSIDFTPKYMSKTLTINNNINNNINNRLDISYANKQ